MLTVYEGIKRQSLLFFLLELESIDLSAAARTTIAVVKPARLDGASELHLRLTEDQLQKLGGLFILIHSMQL